jgi:tetratricopeptide (TPR) repeat protein
MKMAHNKLSTTRKMISRKSFIKILYAAFETNSFRFARQSVEFWLSKFPGDLEVSFYMAKALLWEGNSCDAIELLINICRLDPEYVEALELLAKAQCEEEASTQIDALSCVYAMGKSIEKDFPVPEWSFLFRSAWQSFLGEQFEVAEDLIRQVVALKPDLPLAAILHLMIAKARKNIASHQLANIYHSRWPDCLQFSLILAEMNMEIGNEADAVDLLHRCVTRDVIGQVSSRLWGAQHPYKTLWPQSFNIEFDLPIPAPVASYLGWNKLPPGEPVSDIPSNENEPIKAVSTKKYSGNQILSNKDNDINNINTKVDVNKRTRSIKSEFSKEHQIHRNVENEEVISKVEEVFSNLAKKLKNPEITKTDGRFPMYVIFTSKKMIIEKYGRQTFSVLDFEIKRLASAIQKKHGWGAISFYPDDAGSAVHYGMTAIDSIDPWNLKLAIADLDKFLAKKGSMIGALLIVGGPDIVPFHNLPNPTDDMDESWAVTWRF